MIFYALLLLLAIVPLAVTIGAAVGGRWPAKAMATAATVIFAIWLAFFVISWSDYDDADGWIDCGDSCTTLQKVTGSVLFYGLAALLLCLLAVLAARLVGRLRTPHR